MNAIWRFPLPLQDESSVHMPEGAIILSVQLQYGQLALWAVVDPSKPLETRYFEIIGTGLEFRESTRNHIATIQTESGSLVWHIFEIP